MYLLPLSLYAWIKQSQIEDLLPIFFPATLKNQRFIEMIQGKLGFTFEKYTGFSILLSYACGISLITSHQLDSLRHILSGCLFVFLAESFGSPPLLIK